GANRYGARATGAAPGTKSIQNSTCRVGGIPAISEPGLHSVYKTTIDTTGHRGSWLSRSSNSRTLLNLTPRSRSRAIELCRWFEKSEMVLALVIVPKETRLDTRDKNLFVTIVRNITTTIAGQLATTMEGWAILRKTVGGGQLQFVMDVEKRVTPRTIVRKRTTLKKKLRASQQEKEQMEQAFRQVIDWIREKFGVEISPCMADDDATTPDDACL
nr:hypothetical protein [Tanacetum cinerariifolium]